MNAIDQRKPAAEGGGLFTIPQTKFAVLVWNVNDSEQLLLQVLTVHLCGGKISVKFTSSDNIANNFAMEILSQVECSFSSKAKIDCLRELPKVQSYIDP